MLYYGSNGQTVFRSRGKSSKLHLASENGQNLSLLQLLPNTNYKRRMVLADAWEQMLTHYCPEGISEKKTCEKDNTYFKLRSFVLF